MLALLGVVVVVILLFIVGAGDEHEPIVKPETSEEGHEVLAQLNAEREFQNNLLDELKKQDPSVFDAYHSIDDRGNKFLTIARETPKGEVETLIVPVSDVQRWKEEGTAQAQDSGDSSGILPGLLMGYMASQLLSSSGGSSVMHESRNAFSTQRNEAVNRYTRSLSPGLSAIARSGSNFTGSSVGGSFSSSGARSGGYASGG